MTQILSQDTDICEWKWTELKQGTVPALITLKVLFSFLTAKILHLNIWPYRGKPGHFYLILFSFFFWIYADTLQEGRVADGKVEQSNMTQKERQKAKYPVFRSQKADHSYLTKRNHPLGYKLLQ